MTLLDYGIIGLMLGLAWCLFTDNLHYKREEKRWRVLERLNW